MGRIVSSPPASAQPSRRLNQRSPRHVRPTPPKKKKSHAALVLITLPLRHRSSLSAPQFTAANGRPANPNHFIPMSSTSIFSHDGFVLAPPPPPPHRCDWPPVVALRELDSDWLISQLRRHRAIFKIKKKTGSAQKEKVRLYI